MKPNDDLFFESRFLDTYAGSIISDPATAIVELVANCWDAYATRVDVAWPDKKAGKQFSIIDNGKGMSWDEFQFIWRAMSYDRVKRDGTVTNPPSGVVGAPRQVFGRNGKGRFATFCFSSEYTVTSWKDGTRFKCLVKRAADKPFVLELLEHTTDSVSGHGTQIVGCGEIPPVGLSESAVREVIGGRFLADPAFHVYLGGKQISFSDISDRMLSTVRLEVDNAGPVTIRHIDTLKADRTTKQHGLAWWVQRRAVGECGWRGTDVERILDGRTSEAKRYTFIVEADFLNAENAVRDDWSGFVEDNVVWKRVQLAVQQKIKALILEANRSARESKRIAVLERVGVEVNALSPLSKDRVRTFVDEVVESCPSFGEQEIIKLASILAKLEKTKSLYGLLDVLNSQQVEDLDSLHDLLKQWTVGLAKIVLDEIQSRLRLIAELKQRVAKAGVDEVQELQPLFTRGLWMFGAQFESIEFTSNKGMTTVIRQIFGDKKAKGSLSRPDFVAVPDGSVGLYARSSYDDDFNEDGVEHLVVVDLKTTGLALGSREKEQVWRYVKELRSHGYLTSSTRVDCFVLGDKIDEGEHEAQMRGESVRIAPMLYDTIIRRAERRLLNLHEKVQHAPFLLDQQNELASFLEPVVVVQPELRQVGK